MKNLLKNSLKTLLGLVILLTLVVVTRTILFDSKQIHPYEVASLNIDLDAAAQRLSKGLQFETISKPDTVLQDDKAFFGFHRFLEEQYPLVHQKLSKEVVNKYDLFYTLQGQDMSLAPIILMAHFDVVPIATETASSWTYPPFSGRIADGYIWGRGVLDMKGTLFAEMEALEHLLTNGFVPKRTIHLLYSHDEEVGGKMGNARTAERLEQLGVKAYLILDEGLPILDGILPGVTKQVANIGVAEKGYLTLKLSAKGKGGHSSMPPRHSAIGVLSEAISKIENNPLPGGLRGVPLEMFEFLGPELPLFKRAIFANLWLTAPLVESEFASSLPGNALLRTTTAVTMIDGGVKESVLPQTANAIINFRIFPGDTVESVTSYITAIVDDARVEISDVGFMHAEPSQVSSTASEQFSILQKSIMETFPDVLVAPGLVVGATDSRYFEGVSENIFRFFPWRLTKTDTARIHGVDERLSVENYGEAIRFYHQFIINSSINVD